MTKQEAFQFLDNLAKGISLIFGSNCETIIHEITGSEMLNLAIYNGHVSGRSVGSKIGIFDHSMVDTSGIKVDTSRDIINQLVTLRGGRKVKSSTFFLRGDDYVYALGINYDISIMEQMEKLLSSVTAVDGNLFDTMAGFSPKGESQLDQLFTAAQKQFPIPIDKMSKEDRLSLVKILKEMNFFHVQKSVPFLSEKLQVSKYTIYKYLNELGPEN